MSAGIALARGQAERQCRDPDRHCDDHASAYTGNKLADTITAGGANDTLTGGGYDTYKLGAGMGHAVVNNLNADGVTTAMARSTSAPALPARISGSCAAATISRST
jgi:hypothetical protein